MTYTITVLEKMIDNYDTNIKMFQSLATSTGDQITFNRLAELVANRRYIAALIENDGVKDESFERFGNIFLNTMSYSAVAGADTSWWG